MRKRLGQQNFPVISYERVYQVIMDIVLSHPYEFPYLFPMMGIFHIEEVALHCAVKYFKGNSIDALEAILLNQCHLEAIMCVP